MRPTCTNGPRHRSAPAETVPFPVVLDTCVLYPAHLRDTFLRLGERDLYRALWSADIVEELRRNLSEVVDASAVDHLVGQMTAAFPDAEVTGYQSLIDGLACDPKDRHVLADLLDLAPGAVIDDLSQQAAANRRSPRTLSEILDALERGGVPAFADEVRRRTARLG